MPDPNCKRCNGTGDYEYDGDLHKSAGIYPCGCTFVTAPAHCVFSYKLFDWSTNDRTLLIMRRPTVNGIPHSFPLKHLAIQGKYEKKEFAYRSFNSDSDYYYYDAPDGTVALIERD